MRLEDEAKRAGGRVESLLGNHEVMNLLHEFRDVSPAAYASFADARSEGRRQRAFDDYVRLVKRRATPGEAAPARDAWLATHPPGFLEYVEALGPRGKYGRWLRSHKVVFTDDRTAFMHAGVRPAWPATLRRHQPHRGDRDIAAWDDTKAMMVKAQIVPAFCTLPEAVEAAVAELQRISAALQASAPPGDHVTREFVEQLQTLLAVGKSSLFEPEGPLWFRGFALWPETPGKQRRASHAGPRQVRRRAVRHRSHALAVGPDRLALQQSPHPDRHRHGRFKNGRASALELQAGRITAIYTDSRTPIVAVGPAYFRREDWTGFFFPVAVRPAFFDRGFETAAASAPARY